MEVALHNVAVHEAVAYRGAFEAFVEHYSNQQYLKIFTRPLRFELICDLNFFCVLTKPYYPCTIGQTETPLFTD